MHKFLSLFSVRQQRIVGVAFICFLLLIGGLLGGCSNLQLDLNSINSNSVDTSDTSNQATIDTELEEDLSSDSNLTSFEEVADYLRQYGELPDNFIKKKEAEALGWVASQGNLHEVAPGKSIGGDTFGNREGLLPKADGRKWYEADINYNGGRRNGDRIVFSNDGLIYMTTDHYNSFIDITEGMPE